MGTHNSPVDKNLINLFLSSKDSKIKNAIPANTGRREVTANVKNIPARISFFEKNEIKLKVRNKKAVTWAKYQVVPTTLAQK